MTALVIVIYDRIENLKQWAHCMKQIDRNYRVYVIHNAQPDRQYQQICDDANFIYVARKNQGFDIGAFQDWCKGRIDALKDVTRVLWVTDDVLPMQKDFMEKFLDKMQPGVGVACMQISTSVRPHIRTTGFMIDLVIAKQLKFPVDPIVTKWHCYLFEHKDAKISFADQIRTMGLSIEQVTKIKDSPLWDQGYHKRLERMAEHEVVFGRNKDRVAPVTFVATILNGYPLIISSLLTQTYTNWKLLLIHNGPNGKIQVPDDPRITYIETPEQKGDYGHYIRAEYLQKVQSEFIVITSHDNYYVPGYTKLMLDSFAPDTVGVYPAQMVHNYIQWKVIDCRLERGYIDCGAMMLRTAPAKQVGWRDVTTHSADWVFFSDLIKQYGIGKFKKREGCLYCHN